MSRSIHSLRMMTGLVLLTFGIAACGPIVMVPGGRLSGEVKPTPESWAFTDESDTVQLETRPDDPYSVNIWVVQSDNQLYVAAGSGHETTWAQHLSADPRVRLRVDGALYELVAVEADDEMSRDRFIAAAREKYDFDPEGQDTSQAILYRLDPRS